MKKHIILSFLFSVAATVAAFSQKTQQPNVSAAPAPKVVAKETDKTTGVERADPKTAEKPDKSKEALKAATKRKMAKNKTQNKSKGTGGTATGKNERRENTQEATKTVEKSKNSTPAGGSSARPQKSTPRATEPNKSEQLKKKDN